LPVEVRSLADELGHVAEMAGEDHGCLLVATTTVATRESPHV
jgi:hypothetical protein